MQVTFGFVYYFMLFLIGCTLFLSLFAIRAIRKLFFNIADKLKLFQNQFLTAAKFIAFAVIFIILFDSINTYISFQGVRQLEKKYHNKMDLVSSDDLANYKVLRQFYMAQRNFMLTSSALFIYFAFDRILQAFRKLTLLENQNQQKKIQMKKVK